MKIFIWLISLIFLTVFQGSKLNPFVVMGITPDYILIAVYFFGAGYGDIKGGFFGAVTGFIMDVISAGPVYYNIFTKFFAGYLSGILERWVQNPGFLMHSGLLFMLSLIQSLIILTAYIILGTVQFPDDLFRIAIPQAVVDGLLGGIAYLLIFRRERDTVSRWGSVIK